VKRAIEIFDQSEAFLPRAATPTALRRSLDNRNHLHFLFRKVIAAAPLEFFDFLQQKRPKIAFACLITIQQRL
jgi:hypothetical protein